MRHGWSWYLTIFGGSSLMMGFLNIVGRTDISWAIIIGLPFTLPFFVFLFACCRALRYSITKVDKKKPPIPDSFVEGAWITCIDNDGMVSSLTIGKDYQICPTKQQEFKTKINAVSIVCDKGHTILAHHTRFKLNPVSL